jgi:hypothetical protein
MLLQFGINYYLMVYLEENECVLSTTEEEYIEACSTSSEVVWLRKLLAGLIVLNLETTCIWCDNHICVKLTKNSMFHEKSKHIEIMYHYIRDMVQKGVVKL